MAPPNTLPTRQLGKDGPQVPALGFGMMGLSTAYGSVPPDEERFKILDRAWELGATFWDTAQEYGDSEVLIGKWFKKHPERRKDIFLATKFGVSWSITPENTVKLLMDSGPENARKVCDEARQKLGVDYIDLFYVHRFDGKVPVEKTMEALVSLQKEGKIKHIGFSECSSNTLRRGSAIGHVSAVQIEYNPWTLDIEGAAGTNLLATCRELGVAVVTFSPLGRGFLTGRYKSFDDLEENDARRRLPRFSRENFSKNLDLVKIFEELAAQKGATPAQVVLAWIQAQGPDFFPIPGTKNIKYLEQNLGALKVTISKEDDARIRETIASLGGVAGERTPAGIEQNFGDTPPLE